MYTNSHNICYIMIILQLVRAYRYYAIRFKNNNINIHKVRKSTDQSYHIWHFLTGFIKEPGLHWKSLLNSSRLENEPMIRKRWGEWESLIIKFFSRSSEYSEHHTLAALTQNICCGVYFCRKGSRGSTPCCLVHTLYALYASLEPLLSAMFSSCVLLPFNYRKWS